MLILILIEILLYLILGLMFWGTIVYFKDVRESLKPGRTVYASSNLSKIKQPLKEVIDKYLSDQTKEYEFLEIGAGMAYVADFFAREYKWKKVEAVEVLPSIFFLAKLRLKIKRSKVRIIKKDILEVSPDKPAFIYSYLFSELIEEYFKKGYLEDCVLVSLTFPLKTFEPTETIEISNWQKRLYVYDLRYKKNK